MHQLLQSSPTAGLYSMINIQNVSSSSSFLGYVDKLGVAYEAPTVATGFGAYLAQVSPCLKYEKLQPFSKLSREKCE